MTRGQITDSAVKGQFSGHETFPLRHLWLRKAYDEVGTGAPRAIFSDADAIVRFGVGKNMALAIRYWALAAGIIEETEALLRSTRLGQSVFGRWDPYMESPITAWIIHWEIASRPTPATTIHWAFNHVATQTFDAESLASEILSYARERKWSRVADKTVERDVDCFLRGYAPRQDKHLGEDALEPVLAELGLVRALPGRLYEFARGPKPSLPAEVFAYALDEFWRHHARDGAKTLSVEAATYEPGSPGRVFKLDENSVVERLADIGTATSGTMVWSDTAGVRQVSRRSAFPDRIKLVDQAYRTARQKRAKQ
jgi:hypothetical protein